MSAYEFSSPLFIKTLNTNESIIIGSINLPNTLAGITELKYVRAAINVENFVITNESFKMEIHGEATCSSKIAESSALRLADYPQITSRWNGLIAFTFTPLALNLNVTYYLKIVPSNYIRPSVDSYIAFAFDWPVSRLGNNNAIPWFRPIAFEPLIYGKPQ